MKKIGAAMDMRSATAPNNIKIKLLLFVTTHYKKGAKTKILPLRNTTLSYSCTAAGQRGDFFLVGILHNFTVTNFT